MTQSAYRSLKIYWKDNAGVLFSMRSSLIIFLLFLLFNGKDASFSESLFPLSGYGHAAAAVLSGGVSGGGSAFGMFSFSLHSFLAITPIMLPVSAVTRIVHYLTVRGYPDAVTEAIRQRREKPL